MCASHLKVEELAPRMRPAAQLGDDAFRIGGKQLFVSAVVIHPKAALLILQKVSRMLTRAAAHVSVFLDCCCGLDKFQFTPVQSEPNFFIMAGNATDRCKVPTHQRANHHSSLLHFLVRQVYCLLPQCLECHKLQLGYSDYCH